ncbi:MAG: ATP synthase F1 subunit delta [Eubacteriales bacterium]|nr:ATP synthase F1 subunit delta [Eubacteriales bacterium]
MTETSINYAKALYGLSVPEDAVDRTEQLFKTVPDIGSILENPLISLKEKEQVIDRVFPLEMRNFLKVACKYHKIGSIQDIIEAYGEYSREQKEILQAVLTYVTLPREDQIAKMKEFLCREFSAREVSLCLKEDKSLIGGFILQAGDYQYDWSLRGRYRNLEQKLTRR